MIRAAVHAFAVALLLGPAAGSATAGAPPRPVALTAAPAHLMLAGSGAGAVRVTNTGTERVLVETAVAGFALDLRGRPHIVRRAGSRSAARWLTLRPMRFTLGPRASASLFVASETPPGATPGDHDALVLLTVRRFSTGVRVTVRLRLGVVVVVRAAGALERRLQLAGLRLTRRGSARVLALAIFNRGNVTESLQRPRARLSGGPGGRARETLVAASRDIRPRTRASVEFRLRRVLRGRTTVRVVIPGEPGRAALRRTYRIRL